MATRLATRLAEDDALHGLMFWRQTRIERERESERREKERRPSRLDRAAIDDKDSKQVHLSLPLAVSAFLTNFFVYPTRGMNQIQMVNFDPSSLLSGL